MTVAECGKFIVKKENYFNVNKVKRDESLSNEAKRIFFSFEVMARNSCYWIILFLLVVPDT